MRVGNQLYYAPSGKQTLAPSLQTFQDYSPMPPRRKPKPRPRNRGYQVKRRTKRENLVTSDGNLLFTKFRNLDERTDFQGKTLKRHYKLETLTNALEKQIRSNDRFILSSIQSVMGPAKMKTLTFDLVAENRYKLTFHCKAVNINRNQVSFALVVAKNNQEYSELVRKEISMLRVLQERLPKWTVETLKSGLIFLPDRHRRKEFERDLNAYMALWPKGFHELGVQKNNCLRVNSPRSEHFTHVQSQALKRRMVEIILRTYDPIRRNGMAIPQLLSSDFFVTNPGKNTSQIKIMGCREMQNRVSPIKLVHRILDAAWDWNKRPYALAPDDPREIFQAFVNALGKETTMEWFSDYKKAVTSKRLPELDRLDLQALEKLNIP